ncbi:aconitate hydratase [Streptomyces sp. SID10853]|uniref:aconitate hydratase n=1 Tax=Streptomyces sp. SID10853 TaxID=2706028 RepID=UPI0013C07503|nr:aconitate hydratase [Streptomyces sp. SID10853]NDZ79316.1 aconitate hydratase [Streptomyces sp. SID10853]
MEASGQPERATGDTAQTARTAHTARTAEAGPAGRPGRNAHGTVTHQLIEDHLVEGRMVPGTEIGLRVDQTLTQDATGTLVMQELEALGLDRVRTEASVQYVDHNIIQTDERNAEDHAFLRSAARRLGVWYSKPGNGVSHPVHMQHFGVPGRTLAGSDSHTCAAGSLGMFAVGTGGLEVALAMAGRPLRITMPHIWGVRLTGALPEWVSAKDVVLEMLRRHGVKGAVNRVLEYHGPGLASLSAMDRHVIANMGAELGATTTVFPSDDAVRAFLRSEGREDAWTPLWAADDAVYDLDEEIDLAALEPLIARPTSPGNVMPVREVAGEPVGQAVIGSSANPGLRDFAMAAEMVRGRQTPPGVSFDVNPTSREILQDLSHSGAVFDLIAAGARIHQAGCLGCIGMGQAPAVGRNSLRTFPRNFPGRSGTQDDAVWLCSPETATASALTGVITDPRDWAAETGLAYPKVQALRAEPVNTAMLEPPLPPDEASRVELERGPGVSALPDLDPLPDTVRLPVLLKMGDNVSTDEISPAGAKALPYRSNIPRLAEFTFTRIDPDYPSRAAECRDAGGHLVVGGDNYGQGSSREHAALTPRYLGLRVVIAKSYARIHWQNLANFGVLALEFDDPADYDRVGQGDEILLEGLHAALAPDAEPSLVAVNTTRDERYRVHHRLPAHRRRTVLLGGIIPAVAAEEAGH